MNCYGKIWMVVGDREKEERGGEGGCGVTSDLVPEFIVCFTFRYNRVN